MSMQRVHIIGALTCYRTIRKAHFGNSASKKRWSWRSYRATNSNNTKIQNWRSANWSVCCEIAAPITMGSFRSTKRTRNSRHASPTVSNNSASTSNWPIGEFNSYIHGNFIAHLNHVYEKCDNTHRNLPLHHIHISTMFVRRWRLRIPIHLC